MYSYYLTIRYQCIVFLGGKDNGVGMVLVGIWFYFGVFCHIKIVYIGKKPYLCTLKCCSVPNPQEWRRSGATVACNVEQKTDNKRYGICRILE